MSAESKDVSTTAISAAVLTVGCATLFLTEFYIAGFLPLVLVPLGLVLALSYILTFKPENFLVVGGCALISTALPLLFYVFDFTNYSGQSLIVPFSGLIGVILILSFGFQIFRNDHSNSISTVFNCLAVSLLICSGLAHLLAYNIFDHSCANVVYLALLSMSFVGFVNLVSALFQFLLKKTATPKVKLIVDCVSLSISLIVLFFLLNEFNTVSVPITYLQLIFVATMLLLVFITTHRQFGPGKGKPVAVLFGTFPLVSTGVLLYIILAYTGVGV
ncbi:hypothetical protein FACS1894125_2770 [Actinomycetota bacterium]|nr:hypothetical protein FACS1894125_2770 [Actinomycetota bacterium]